MNDTINPGSTAMAELLNSIIGTTWTAYAQHTAHAALIESWGLLGLAGALNAHIADEPETIRAALDRLVEIEGKPEFQIGKVQVGASLREALDNDLQRQIRAPGLLNEAAEAAAAAHDATTRRLIEDILAGEEEHLDWLRTEVELLDRLGESLYIANRLNSTEGGSPAVA
jgi:bacterioferritin